MGAPCRPAARAVARRRGGVSAATAVSLAHHESALSDPDDLRKSPDRINQHGSAPDRARHGTRRHRAHLYEDLDSLPHFNPDDDREPIPPAVADLRARIKAADALLFCTPEYAGALPGSFKNLLDWAVGGGEIYRKPVAWINASASPTGAAGAHDSLRTVLSYTGADIVDTACAHIPVARQAIGPDGLIHDPALRKLVVGALTALAEHTDKSRGEQAPA